jgi:hypothetical protein
MGDSTWNLEIFPPKFLCRPSSTGLADDAREERSELSELSLLRRLCTPSEVPLRMDSRLDDMAEEQELPPPPP